MHQRDCENRALMRLSVSVGTRHWGAEWGVRVSGHICGRENANGFGKRPEDDEARTARTRARAGRHEGVLGSRNTEGLGAVCRKLEGLAGVMNAVGMRKWKKA